jgi:hypothetical protein
MKPAYTKFALITVWVIAVGVAAYLAGNHSTFSWMVLIAVAILPPVLMLKLWQVPPQTTSESIRQALR